MNGKTLLRWGMLLALLAVFVGGLIYAALPPEVPTGETCMGVQMLSESEMAGMGSYQYRDYSENLKFQNEFAAVDQETSVIYISQNIDETTKISDLAGLLTIDVPGQQLYFAPDANWENLKEAVRNGHAFKLLICGFQNTYMQYDVVFTTLPVISMHGQLLYKNSDARDVLSGRVTLWDPENSGVLSSGVHWHVRGKSAGGQEKKPWKLSLKDWDGKNTNENLLGLGSDDDWILNAMNMEDSNVREKLFMDLWNEMASVTDYNHPMSRGEYVEVLVNGEYHGLYLLQRRVDEKYLNLDDGAVVVKVDSDSSELVYEYSLRPGVEISETQLHALFVDLDCRPLVRENFVDVSLILQMFAARDNAQYKNIYYVFEKDENGYSISLVPWDTDMAMGTRWVNEELGFQYDYDESLRGMVERREMGAMQQLYPDLNRDFQIRWAELRKNLFSAEYITAKMTDYLDMLETTGAPARDQEKWGLFYEGEDTVAKMYQFVEDRLDILDAYYAG